MAGQGLNHRRSCLPLPNELLADLVNFLLNDSVYNLVVNKSSHQLYCGKPSNWFEHFLKKHFIKHFVQTKNRWFLEHERGYGPKLELKGPNSLIVAVKKDNSQIDGHFQWIQAWRPLSSANSHTYFEVKLVEKKAVDRIMFLLGLLDLPTSTKYGCMMASYACQPLQLVSCKWEAKHCESMVVGDVFGCGFSVPPPVQQNDDDDGDQKTIIFTINGQRIGERIELPPGINFTQLHPFLLLADFCELEANFGAIPFVYAAGGDGDVGKISNN